MIKAIIPALMAISFMQPNTANAESAFDLLESGYQIVWKGYANISTCVDEDDVYELGSYVFVCDQYDYKYPYHYGNVFLMASAFEYEGRSFMMNYLCLDEDGDCIKGTIYRR